MIAAPAVFLARMIQHSWALVVFINLLLALLATRFAAGFRPPKLSEELGCSPTLSLLFQNDNGPRNRRRRDSLSLSDATSTNLFYFDPVGFARDDNFARLREAELKHGRICMLATLEIILVPLLKRSTLAQDWVPGLRECSESILFDNSVSLLEILKVVAACGLLEIFVFWQKDPKDMPGDYGVGYFGLRDYGMHEDELVMELEHGRLAMLGFVGSLASDVVTKGESWVEYWLRWLDSLSVVVYFPR